MQVQKLAQSFNAFYLQYHLAILFTWLLVMSLFAFFGTQGVVFADGLGTGGGACSGC